MEPSSPDSVLSVGEWIYVFVASFSGATTSILLKVMDVGKLPRIEVFATYFIGISFAMFFSNAVGVFFEIPSGISLTLGGSAMMSGMLGIRASRMISKLATKFMGDK